MRKEKYSHYNFKWVMIAVMLFMLCALNSYAQEKILLKGTVIDSADSQPILGVTVLIKGTTVGAKTDEHGRYAISANNNDTLRFAFLGYNTQTVPVRGRSLINVQLATENQNLSEVVVVAYGQQKKVSVTGAISTVKAEDLRKSSSASLANSLAGRLSGLTSIQSGGGQPGRDDATMYLRGAATTNGKGPLILIDGVPRDNIRTLDASEVESVSVLKDASATAVFGVRGANGVILITTKRGKEGSATLNASFDQSYSAFTYEPERLSSLAYIDLRNEASKNDNVVKLPFSEEVRQKYENPLLGLDPNDPDYANQVKIREYMYPNHDYYREFISHYAPQSRLNVNASGGSDKVSYFVNAAYLHQGGNLNTEPQSVLGYDPSSWLDRYNFRANLDYQVTSSLKTFLNIGSYIERVNMPAAWLYNDDTNWMMRDLIYQAQTILPITPGPTTIAGFGVAPGQLVDPGYLDRSAFEIINRMGYRNEMRSNLNTTLGAEWDLSKTITQGLSIKGMVSYDTRATSAMQAKKSERLYLAQINYETNELSYAAKRPDETLLSLVKGVDSRYNINLQGAINYARTFGEKHEVGGMILAQRDNWESTGGDLPFNVLGIAARATYGYDNRYLAEINMGYNGSEQFAPSKRFGFFPALSLGWVLSNEAFLQENKTITNLKLRASYGKVGNDKIDDKRFLYQSDITVGGAILGSLGVGTDGQGSSINQGLIGNPVITWETAEKQNYGIDLQLFGGLNITADYFKEHRSDILIARGTVPELQGTPLGNIPKVNMGIVDNSGYEFEMSYNKALTQNFSFRLRGNIGVNKNEVKFIDEAIRDESYAYRYNSTGFGIGQSWGYKIDYGNGNGYFNSQEELDDYLSHTTYGFGTPRVGDFKYVDLNGDGVVNDKDQAPIKYTNIPGLIYGFEVGFAFRSFDFSAFFQGVSRYSSNYAEQGVYENIKEGTYFGYHKNAWTPERYAKGEEITYPALSTQKTTNHTANDFFIMDRSFIRLKNIELAYTLPPNSLRMIGVSSLRIYVGAQNWITWDKLKTDSLDPEQNDAIGYPITKTLNFGLNITL